IDGSNSNAGISQVINTTTGNWYLATFWARASTTSKTARSDFGAPAYLYTLSGTTYQQFFTSVRATAGTTTISIRQGTGTSASIYVDDMSVKQLTFTELVSSI